MIFPPSLFRHALLHAALLALLSVALTLPASGQTTLVGRVHDESESPVPGANVLLLSAADSSLVQGAVTTDDGRFAIEAVAAGTYRLRVSFVGFTEHLSAPFVLNGAARHDVGTISLRPGDLLLDGVLVEARRSLFEQRSDRLIVNVGSSVTLAGTDALTVLQRSPGVVVSEQSGTVSLIGKRGVQIMVNGRLTNVPPDALVQYLAGLNADAIERIELITAPPASMDADGDAGFINIVLKRSPEEGLRGTASLSGGYGEGEVGSASTNLSVRRGALRAFGNYSFSWNNRNTTLTNARRVDDGRGILTTRSFSNRDPLQRNHNARLGLDVDLSDRTAVGAVVAGYDHRWTMDASTTQRILRDGAQTGRTTIDNGEVNHWQHLMGNVHIEHHLAAGGTLRADADYLYYRNDNPNDFTILSRDGGPDPGAPEDAATRKTTPFRIGVVKADYNRSLRSTWTLGSGVKASFARFTNDVQLERLLPGVPLGDASPAEDSRLTENVFAAYLESDVQVTPSISVKAGLRFEHAVSALDLNESGDSASSLLDRRTSQLFPSVVYTHELASRRQVVASYTRRITRPSFNDMAPFVFFVDPSTFFTGNPALQPALSNTLKLDYTHGTLFTSLQYARETSTIARFQNELIPENNLQRIAPVNYDRRRSVTALVSQPVRLASWWTSENSVLLGWQKVTAGASRGVAGSNPQERVQRSLRISATQSVSLPRGFGVEASGFYQSADLFGLVRFDPTWALTLGVERTLPGGWGRLTLSVDDVFDSDERTGVTRLPGDGTYAERTVDFSPRTLRLTYSLPFGRGKAARAPETASEEERRRVQ